MHQLGQAHLQDSPVQYLEESLTGFSGKVTIHGMNEMFSFYSRDPLTQILVAAGQHHTDLMEPEGFQIYNQITTLELCACYANDFYPT
ncbi:uncharacterized protein LOC106145044 isoform X5 [Ictidomys tridecemlineatus]|uniref:uncharacterized protein LOC106145044 isoform X3 n=1 Tax=Ictidomys tridecemlineatus TaxID=43179 RepID=UPI001A9D1E53|nr:uncharacterized protein LOC106145044 isoform X3 [Ictidomys tridecemlineatus]